MPISGRRHGHPGPAEHASTAGSAETAPQGAAPVARWSDMLGTLNAKLGPGLVFAASAVGVSHLVQSTRAGADHGLTLIGFIVLVNVIKYPVFAFGAMYAASAGESLVAGYARLGKPVLVALLCFLMYDLLIALAAVSLVTSGLAISIFSIPASSLVVAQAMLTACMAVVIWGRYRLFETITKGLVAAFSVLVVVAALMALAGVEPHAEDLLPRYRFDSAGVLFLIAVAGWMPIGIGGSVMLSLWVVARSDAIGRRVRLDEAVFDFNVGYGASTLIAVCFVVLGAFVLYGSGVSTAGSPDGFAASLIRLFTAVFGGWSFLVITSAALAVMLSTLLALVDSFPRNVGAVVARLRGSNEHELERGPLFLVLLGAAWAFVWVFLATFASEPQSFGRFINLATSLGLLVAPFMAYFNHRVMCSDAVPVGSRPGAWLRAWSWVGIAAFAAAAFGFAYLGLTG
jgi:Mn2+/Fe2+ NRAMP family transporter